MKKPKILRDVTDIKMTYQGDLVVSLRDGLGQREDHKLLDMDKETIYNIIIDAYYLGKIEQSNEIKKVLGL